MNQKTMKAIVIYEAGGPEKLVYTEVPVPEVKPGWSLVRIVGRGVNHSEIFTRDGQSPSVTFPRILGIECVGVIAESTDPARLPMGQKVILSRDNRPAVGDPRRASRDLLHCLRIHEESADHGRQQDSCARRNERRRNRLRKACEERLQGCTGDGNDEKYAQSRGSSERRV